MKAYFQKKDETDITRTDYTTLCLRFCCEAYGAPIFGPFNDKILEFQENDITPLRKRLLTNLKYIKVSRPPESERNPDSNLAKAIFS